MGHACLDCESFHPRQTVSTSHLRISWPSGPRLISRVWVFPGVCPSEGRLAAGIHTPRPKGWPQGICLWGVGDGMELGHGSGGDCIPLCEVPGTVGWKRERWLMASFIWIMFLHRTLRNSRILSVNLAFQVLMIGKWNIFNSLLAYCISLKCLDIWFVDLSLYSCLDLGPVNVRGGTGQCPRSPCLPFSKGSYYPDFYDTHFFVFLCSFTICLPPWKI